MLKHSEYDNEHNKQYLDEMISSDKDNKELDQLPNESNVIMHDFPSIEEINASIRYISALDKGIVKRYIMTGDSNSKSLTIECYTYHKDNMQEVIEHFIVIKSAYIAKKMAIALNKWADDITGNNVITRITRRD